MKLCRIPECKSNGGPRNCIGRGCQWIPTIKVPKLIFAWYSFRSTVDNQVQTNADISYKGLGVCTISIEFREEIKRDPKTYTYFIEISRS